MMMYMSMVETNFKIVFHCSTFWSWHWPFDFWSLQLLHRMNNLTMSKVHAANIITKYEDHSHK